MGKIVKLSVRELFVEKLILRTIENERRESICKTEKVPTLGERDSDDNDKEMIYTDHHERKVLVAST